MSDSLPQTDGGSIMLVSGRMCKSHDRVHRRPQREELGICPYFLIQILFQKNASGTLKCSGRVTKLKTLEIKQGHRNTFQLQNVFLGA